MTVPTSESLVVLPSETRGPHVAWTRWALGHEEAFDLGQPMGGRAPKEADDRGPSTPVLLDPETREGWPLRSPATSTCPECGGSPRPGCPYPCGIAVGDDPARMPSTWRRLGDPLPAVVGRVVAWGALRPRGELAYVQHARPMDLRIVCAMCLQEERLTPATVVTNSDFTWVEGWILAECAEHWAHDSSRAEARGKPVWDADAIEARLRARYGVPGSPAVE